MVPLALKESRPLLIGLRLLLPRAVEDVLGLQHGQDCQDFIAASQIHAGDQHLGHGGVHRELRHLAPQLGQHALIIERAQIVQLLQRAHHCRGRRRVHEIEIEEIVDAHGLQGQYRQREIGPLYLGNRAGQHLVQVGGFCI